MRVLALALGVPFPPVGGGLARTFHLLEALSVRHEVELVAFTYGEPHEPAPYPLRTVPVPWQWSADYLRMSSADEAEARAAAEHLTYRAPEPWFVSALDPAAMTQALQTALVNPPDVILLEGTPLAQFGGSLPAGVPRVLDLFDVHSVMTHRELDGATGKARRALALEAARTLSFERRAVRDAHTCVAVSPDDAAAARALLGALRVEMVPNGVDTAWFRPSPMAAEAGAILFTGRMSYEPNADAACHFVADVLPLVRREVPHAHVHVVGIAPPPRVTALHSDAVTVHGRVDDVRPFQQRAEVVVVPVRAGGGTRLKVLEAAASGKSIVSTPLGIEGLPFQHGRDVLVAGDAPSFAAAVVSLLRDGTRRRELGRHARAVALHYDWTSIGAALRGIVEQAAAHR